MKRFIPMWIILAVEAVLLVVLAIYTAIGSPAFLSFVTIIGETVKNSVLLPLADLVGLGTLPYVDYLVLVAINLAFIILYAIIASIIASCSKKSKEKKIMRVIKKHYELNEAEERRFDEENFKKKFPIRRVLSLLIPLLVIFYFVFTRFDNTICSETSSVMSGFSNLYTNNLKEVIRTIMYNNADEAVAFYEGIVKGYIDLCNRWFASFSWIEYVIIPVLSIALIFIWYGIFSLFALIGKKSRISKRALKARNKYIAKKDKAEYKYRLNHDKEYPNRSEEFIRRYEEEDPSNPIAKIEKRKEKVIEGQNPEYIEDLAQGTRDLGVGEDEAKRRAIIEREVRYIADEDYDIVLEEEPVIETVNEDDLDNIIAQNKEDDLFYEKYVADEVEIKPLEEYQKTNYVLQEEPRVEPVKEEPKPAPQPAPQPEPEPAPVKEEPVVIPAPVVIPEPEPEPQPEPVVEEKVEPVVEEEPVPQEVEPEEEVKEEEDDYQGYESSMTKEKALDLFYRKKKIDHHNEDLKAIGRLVYAQSRGIKVAQPVKEEPVVEEVKEEVKPAEVEAKPAQPKEKKKIIKYVTKEKEYPFRNFRNKDVRTGKVEARIPSLKEQEEMKKAKKKKTK